MLVYSCKPVTGPVIREEVRALRPERVHVPQAFTAYTRMYPSRYGPIGYLVMDPLGGGGPYILGIGRASDHGHHACELARLLDDPSHAALTYLLYSPYVTLVLFITHVATARMPVSPSPPASHLIRRANSSLLSTVFTYNGIIFSGMAPLLSPFSIITSITIYSSGMLLLQF
jgi:hypothetical protein